MPTSKKGVSLVITLVVAGLMIAFLFPIVIGAIGGDESRTVTQDVGETVELQPNLTVTLDSSTSTDSTFTLNASGDTVTFTESEGETSSNYTVDGTTVEVDVTNSTSTSATTTFSYDGTYGWGGGTAALWGILGVILVLVAFIYLVNIAIKQF